MSSSLSFQAGGVSADLVLKPSPRARTMRLRVDARTGTVVLSFPRRISAKKAVEWAAGKRSWVESALAAVPKPIAIEPGSRIMFRGTPHLVDWSPAAPRVPTIEPGRIVVGGPVEGLEARLVRWLKRHALAILEQETRDYAASVGKPVTRVGVGDPVSRWGSCASSGAIRYSWRLILAPDHVRRATVAHEVAHLVHMNHGPKFHALVADIFEGDPAEARAWLRREGLSLHRIARRR